MKFNKKNYEYMNVSVQLLKKPTHFLKYIYNEIHVKVYNKDKIFHKMVYKT